MPNNRLQKRKYYTPPGSYDGLVQVSKKWIKAGWLRCSELNRIDKKGWTRYQGPPNSIMCQCLKAKSIKSTKAFPERIL